MWYALLSSFDAKYFSLELWLQTQQSQAMVLNASNCSYQMHQSLAMVFKRMNFQLQGRSENGHYFGLFNIIVSQISPEIILIIRDASQLSKIMTKPSRIRFFFEKWFFFGKVTPNQKNFMLFADLAWSTKMEYFWASLWPSSSYWIIKWHRCILKLPPYLQGYQWW